MAGPETSMVDAPPPSPASAPSAIGRLINAGSGAMQLQSSSNGQQSSTFPIASTATGSVSFNGQYQQGSNSLIDAVAAKLGLPASTVQEIRVYFGEGPQQKPRLRGGKVLEDPHCGLCPWP